MTRSEEIWKASDIEPTMGERNGFVRGAHWSDENPPTQVDGFKAFLDRHKEESLKFAPPNYLYGKPEEIANILQWRDLCDKLGEALDSMSTHLPGNYEDCMKHRNICDEVLAKYEAAKRDEK